MIIAPLGAVSIAANSAFAVTAKACATCRALRHRIGGDDAANPGATSAQERTDLTQKRYGNICIVMGAGFMAITGLLMMFLCPFVFSILTPDLSPSARLQRRRCASNCWLNRCTAFPSLRRGALRGTGDTFVPKYDEPRQYLNWCASGLPCCSSAISVYRACGRPWQQALRARPFDAVPSENKKYYKKYNKTTETRASLSC